MFELDRRIAAVEALPERIGQVEAAVTDVKRAVSVAETGLELVIRRDEFDETPRPHRDSDQRSSQTSSKTSSPPRIAVVQEVKRGYDSGDRPSCRGAEFARAEDRRAKGPGAEPHFCLSGDAGRSRGRSDDCGLVRLVGVVTKNFLIAEVFCQNTEDGY